MSDIKIPPEDEMVSCEICLKEIPASAANSEEVQEYFHYFCGLECYKKWQEQKNKNNE